MKPDMYNEQATQPMMRVLRHRATREYFSVGGWTKNPEEARKFSDVLEAAQACAEHGLEDVELALRIHAQAPDVFCTALR